MSDTWHCHKCGKFITHRFKRIFSDGSEIDMDMRSVPSGGEHILKECPECYDLRPKIMRDTEDFKSVAEAIGAAGNFVNWLGQSYESAERDERKDEILALMEEFAQKLAPHIEFIKNFDREEHLVIHRMLWPRGNPS